MNFTGKALHFIGEITNASVEDFIARLKRNEAESEGSDLTIIFSSSGGSVSAGLYLHDFLRLQSRRVTMVASSSVSSAGLYPFLAGDIRAALPGATFLLHSMTQTLDGTFTHSELREQLLIFESDRERCRKLVTGRTALKAARWDKLTTEGAVLNVSEALKVKIIHGVASFNRHHPHTKK